MSPLKASIAIFNFNDALIFFFIFSSFLFESSSIKILRKNGLIFGGHYRGHIIDHKYSAGNSHNEEINYIPVHYFYNAPLKEYLVQRSDDYIEIPLFTPNSPRIGVKGDGENFHDIPIGIIFIRRPAKV